MQNVAHVHDDARMKITKDLYTKAQFPGRLVILGCGSIGQCIIPMLMRHTSITPDKVQILAHKDNGQPLAAEYGIDFALETLSADNYADILKKYLKPGDFLLNLSVDVESIDLFTWAQQHDVLYLDTSTEQWPGFSINPDLHLEQRTNYALRERVTELREKYQEGPTAVIDHGANPGLISHFVKAALLDIARDTGFLLSNGIPKDQHSWAKLMADLKVKTIQIAERDTQYSSTYKQPKEFVNTWSIDGLLGEAVQPVELGWGTHEKELPADGHEHQFGSKAAIYLDRPGALTRVRSWTPREGPYHGFLITHDESITIADYFTVRDGDTVIYRPTVMYAYHPCDDAVLSLREYAGNNWREPKKKRIMFDEIEHGSDELGALLMGHKKKSLLVWIRSLYCPGKGAYSSSECYLNAGCSWRPRRTGMGA